MEAQAGMQLQLDVGVLCVFMADPSSECLSHFHPGPGDTCKLRGCCARWPLKHYTSQSGGPHSR